MADDDQSSADPGMPGSPGDPNVPADAPGYPEAGAPKAEAKPEKPQESTSETLEKGYIEMLTKMQQQAAAREQDMQAKLMPMLQDLTKLSYAPIPPPPQGVVAPPPPSEQQKGGLSEFIFNLLKFGALTAIAFGTGGRGMGHNAIWKSAVGAALTGFAAGRKDVVDNSMKVWEKNREIINDANRQQADQYKQILDNQSTSLKQKMDLVNTMATINRDYKAWDTSRREDLTALQDHVEKQMKVQKDKEQWEIDHRDTLYDVLGKNQMTMQYLTWLHEKSGGKVTLTGNSSPDAWHKVEKEHPELSFSSFMKEHTEEEVKKAGEKSKAEAEAKKEVKEGEDKVPDATENAKKAATLLNDLVQ
jgi:hypothetical protein